jgi:uncharacterized membrane protein YfcA
MWSQLIPLALVTVATSILSGVIGMAGGITLLAFMTFVLELGPIIPIHGVVQLASNSSRAYFLRKHVHKRFFFAFIIACPFGTVAAFYLLDMLKGEPILLIPLILLITYALFKPKKLPSIIIDQKGFFILGLITSFLSPLIGATGPILAPFFLRPDLEKEQIVATKALMQTVTHLLKIPIFLSLAFPYQEHLYLILLMVAAALLGTKLGTMLLGKVSTKYFMICYKVAMFLALARLIYKLALSYL